MSTAGNETVDAAVPIAEGTPGMFESTTQTVEVACGAASHTGKVRENNEDHFAVVRRTRSREILLTNVDTSDVHLPDDHAYTLIVADGVGGRGFGELASEFVLRFGWELAGQATSWLMKFEPTKWDEVRERVVEYVRRIQAALQEKARSNPKLAGMGTTWTCFYVVGSDAVLGHAGDSRAYLYRQGTLRQLTRDHTFAQELIELGMAAKDTTKFKHILTNSLGGKNDEVHPEIDHIALLDGDRVLLCTDGLTDMATDGEIAAMLQAHADPQAAVDALIRLALDHGGKDNVTAIVADFRFVGGSRSTQETVETV